MRIENFSTGEEIRNIIRRNTVKERILYRLLQHENDSNEKKLEMEIEEKEEIDRDRQLLCHVKVIISDKKRNKRNRRFYNF